MIPFDLRYACLFVAYERPWRRARGAARAEAVALDACELDSFQAFCTTAAEG